MEPVTLKAGELEATFAPGAGMIGTSLRHRGDELLEQRDGLDAYVKSAKTFGIPLLHPWANRIDGPRYSVAGKDVELDLNSPLVHTEDNGLPIHGLASACPYWEVVGRDTDGLHARLDYGAHEDLLAGFPFPHTLEIEISLDPDALHHTTRLTATTDQPVPVSFGYHPYLTLPGVAREDFLVTFPVCRQMLLDDRGIPTGTDEVANIPPGALGDRTYDDGFSELREPVEFGLEGGGRRIGVRFDEGYPYAQVWAPPGEHFICYEPMTAPTNALVTHRGLSLARPDDAYEARFSVLVIGV
ncbi:MAG TPA: aldose 1-epimerase [Solirubrobacteraceae bacterium]|nr:aldose 1-epimerase [Solirubrobacteraceae bacterium]